MGKGDRRSRKGKIRLGSYGNSRRRKKSKFRFITKPKAKPVLIQKEIKETVAQIVETLVPVIETPVVQTIAVEAQTSPKEAIKKGPVKKSPVKKTVPKKTTVKKVAVKKVIAKKAPAKKAAKKK